MKRANIILAWVAWGMLAFGAETNLCCDVFDYHFAWKLASAPAEFSEAGMKEALSACGVKWPQGSHVYKMFSYGGRVDKVAVVNTPENLERCRGVLFSWRRPERLLEVKFDVYAFQSEDVERLRNAGGTDKEQLLALRKQGRAKLVSSAQAIAKPGHSAEVRSCTEITYPTEFRQVVSTNQNETSVSLVPSGFTMREVGTILRFESEVEENGRILLAIHPQWVTLRGWETFEAKAGSVSDKGQMAFKQPVFREASLQMQFDLHPGESVLVPGGQHPEDGKMILYHFITANIVEVKSDSVKWGGE